MSEKVKEVKSTDYVHEFYCDVCGEKIMDSIEYDDGWYESPEKFNEEIRINANNTVYYYKRGLLCDKCGRYEVKRLDEKLLSIGFKKRGEE